MKIAPFADMAFMVERGTRLRREVGIPVGVSWNLGLPSVADQVIPTVSVRTETGALDVVPGRTVNLVIEATDDVGLAALRLTATGPNGFAFDESRTVPPVSPVSASFALAVPSGLAGGDQIVIAARATDASGNQSVPAQLTLTVRQVSDVTLPASLLLKAGVGGKEEKEITRNTRGYIPKSSIT